MYDFEQLNNMTKEQLKAIAQKKNINRISSMRKLEIIDSILQAQRNDNEEKNVAEVSVTKAAPSEVNVKIAENEKQNEQAQPKERQKNERNKKRERPADVTELTGILDVRAEGYGFLRFENYGSSGEDIYVAPQQIKRFGLKTGDEITGDCRLMHDEDKSSPLLFVKRINGDPLEIALKRKPFEKLVPVFPMERIKLETEKNTFSTRIIDLAAPIGKGQRGMIVAPPKAGKTTIIKDIAKAIRKNSPDIKLIILLIDERPEEVTDIKKNIDCDVIYSTFDQLPSNHCRLAEMVLERAQRLVEQQKDVVVLLDSITRLVRAYNITEQVSGRTLSGGLDVSALYKPKKFFGAARKIENGGSLTIIATALVETGSRMDDVIFEEFKGTGNMELKLDRNLQERRIFPAIDVSKSGTRREDKLLKKDELKASWAMHKVPIDSYYKILSSMRATENNEEFVEYVNRNNGF